MTIAVLFWILYIVGIVFFGFRRGTYDLPTSLWLLALIALLGIGAFGWPIK